MREPQEIQAGQASLPEGAYRALLDSMSEGVSLSTADGVIIYTNPAEDRMFGYGPGELIGQHVKVQNAYPADDNDRIVAEVISELRTRGSWRGEWRNRRKDGSEFLSMSRITAVELDGAPHWLCVQEDITPERSLAEAVRLSEERLEIAVEAADLGVWDWDLLTGEFVYSARAREICGFPPDQPLRLDEIRDVTHPEDYPITSRQAERAFDPAIRSNESYRYRIVRPDGAVRWVQAFGKATFAQVDGVERAVRYAGTLQDITEDHQREAAEQEVARRLRLALDASRMAVWEVDLTSGQVTPSPELSRVLGFPDGASLSLDDLRERYGPGERERLTGLAAEAVARGDRFLEAEFSYRPPSGELRWLLLRSEMIFDRSGKHVRSIGVITDVSERKRSEEHLRLLVNELNHRVKNTLATVQSIAAQSFRGATDPDTALAAFTARLVALAGAHDILTRESWEGADLAEIVGDAIRPFDAEDARRFEVSGPKMRLSPKSALAISMALHELATNASKYGALTADSGRVRLRWTWDGDLLEIIWREDGGPAVEPPTRRGFGSRLVEKALARDLDGEVRLDFVSTGVVCLIRTRPR